MARYKRLFEIVRDLHPKHIVEIGTWNGMNAKSMMAVSDCYYTGFDLFDEATKETDKTEFNVKQHNGIYDVGKAIEMAGFIKFCLIRGNTNETLHKWEIEPFDFAFIDGGHSVKTIENDYEWIAQNISEGGTIILDDWYDPELGNHGCNFLEDKGEVLEQRDKTSKGWVHLLRVMA